MMEKVGLGSCLEVCLQGRPPFGQSSPLPSSCCRPYSPRLFNSSSQFYSAFSPVYSKVVALFRLQWRATVQMWLLYADGMMCKPSFWQHLFKCYHLA